MTYSIDGANPLPPSRLLVAPVPASQTAEPSSKPTAKLKFVACAFSRREAAARMLGLQFLSDAIAAQHSTAAALQRQRLAHEQLGRFISRALNSCESHVYHQIKTKSSGANTVEVGRTPFIQGGAAAAAATPAPACLHSASLSSLGSFTPDDGGRSSCRPCGSSSSGCNASGHCRSSSVLPIMA